MGVETYSRDRGYLAVVGRRDGQPLYEARVGIKSDASREPYVLVLSTTSDTRKGAVLSKVRGLERNADDLVSILPLAVLDDVVPGDGLFLVRRCHVGAVEEVVLVEAGGFVVEAVGQGRWAKSYRCVAVRRDSLPYVYEEGRLTSRSGLTPADPGEVFTSDPEFRGRVLDAVLETMPELRRVVETATDPVRRAA